MSNINEVAADLFAINAQIKALTEQADALKATLKANGSFTCDQYEVKVTTASRTTIDSKALKEKYADIAAECSKISDVTSVTVKKI
jgi:predicted phage-related endonuclease